MELYINTRHLYETEYDIIGFVANGRSWTGGKVIGLAPVSSV